jgi:hypothetical protein
MENVPDVLNHGGQNIAEETCEALEDKGYVCGYTLLNAAYYVGGPPCQAFARVGRSKLREIDENPATTLRIRQTGRATADVLSPPASLFSGLSHLCSSCGRPFQARPPCPSARRIRCDRTRYRRSDHGPCFPRIPHHFYARLDVAPQHFEDHTPGPKPLSISPSGFALNG